MILKSGSLNFLETSGPIQACNGIALPFIILLRIRYRVRFGYQILFDLKGFEIPLRISYSERYNLSPSPSPCDKVTNTSFIDTASLRIEILHCTEGVVSHSSSKRRTLQHSAGEYRGSDEEECLKATGM